MRRRLVLAPWEFRLSLAAVAIVFLRIKEESAHGGWDIGNRLINSDFLGHITKALMFFLFVCRRGSEFNEAYLFQNHNPVKHPNVELP